METPQDVFPLLRGVCFSEDGLEEIAAFRGGFFFACPSLSPLSLLGVDRGVGETRERASNDR